MSYASLNKSYNNNSPIVRCDLENKLYCIEFLPMLFI